jgi:hypothetical protein
MWAAIGRPDWDPARTAAVEGLPTPVRGGPGRVRALARHADGDAWSVDAPQGGLLRVSARYATGWSARLDGRSVPTLRADGIFRSVVVPPGRHTVRFSYANPVQTTGRRLAVLGALACALLVIAGPLRRARRRPAHAAHVSDRPPSDRPEQPAAPAQVIEDGVGP